MATSTCGHGNQAVCAFFNRFVRVLVVDDVVQHHTAVAVRGGVDLFAGAQ